MESKNFFKRIRSMIKADGRRLFVSPFIYVLIGIALVAPILILVMTTMMDGTVSTDPNGNQTIINDFDNVWQIIGSLPNANVDASMGMSMDLVSMCNINMLFFALSALVCVFVSEDFKSGYAKNLFTVRAKKIDYVISKTIICFIGSALMFIAFFIGSIIGGKVAGLPFETVGFSLGNVLCSILSKIFLTPIFVSIFLLMSVIAKQRTWLSICLSLGIGMFLYMMIPMLSPLNANVSHVLFSLLGSVIFSAGLGAISNLILKKTNLI